MNLDNNQSMDEFGDEASMAKADLYKTGKYSIKLIKMIHDGQDLPGWVQAKITKAADYIASVYHFMEYDMNKSEYGDHIENADMYEARLNDKFHQKLTEAKNAQKKQSKKSSMNCNEDCSKCTENCDQQLDEGFEYDEVHSPKFGRAFLANHGGVFVVGIEHANDPVKIVAIDSNYQAIHRKWTQLKHKFQGSPVHEKRNPKVKLPSSKIIRKGNKG